MCWEPIAVEGEAIVNEQKQTSIADDVQNIHEAIS